jgi:hypothetical protein
MSMGTKIDAFITEIRYRPRFKAAVASDPIWSAHLDAIEFALNEIDRRADSAAVGSEGSEAIAGSLGLGSGISDADLLASLALV